MNRPRVSGYGNVGLRAHLLLACSDGEKTSSRRHVNQMMFVSLPVSSGWRYGCDTGLMHWYIQGDSLYIPEKFGGDGKLYVEVRGTWCFMARDLNGRHHHSQQIWRRRKLFITFHLQGHTMILTDWSLWCWICRRRLWKYEVRKYFKMAAKNKMANLVMKCRPIQGNTIYTLGRDGTLYVEVIKTWFLTAKGKNGFHRPAHQVWHSGKISITFNLQGMKMINEATPAS